MHGSRFGKLQLARTNKIQAFGLRQVDFGSPTFVGGLRITLASTTSASPDSPPSLLSHVEARIGDTDPPLSPADPNACLVNKLCFRTEGDVLHEGDCDCYGVSTFPPNWTFSESCLEISSSNTSVWELSVPGNSIQRMCLEMSSYGRFLTLQRMVEGRLGFAEVAVVIPKAR